MKSAATFLALAAVGCSTWLATGRVYRGRCTHVGVRPSTDDLAHDWAASVQVSTDAPWCGAVYPERGRR